MASMKTASELSIDICDYCIITPESIVSELFDEQGPDTYNGDNDVIFAAERTP
jgi:hypothetical protein